MSNELLTKLMDPLEKGYAVNARELIASEGFGDEEQKDVLCTLAAKWYLDASGGDRKEETEEIPTVENLGNILADENAHEIYTFNPADWKKAIGALGTTIVPVACLFFDVEGVWDIVVTVQNMVWGYFKDHVEDILDKIIEIQGVRSSKKNTEPEEQEPEIPEDLKKLRDPLNTDDINIFKLLPAPVYGASTEVTTDDFITWFAKNHVKKGRCIDGLDDMFQECYPYHASSCLRLLCLIGYDGMENHDMGLRYLTESALKNFYENNNSKIISKVKEIMKLWLEHGLI